LRLALTLALLTVVTVAYVFVYFMAEDIFALSE
jgi:hypothetical protein